MTAISKATHEDCLEKLLLSEILNDLLVLHGDVGILLAGVGVIIRGGGAVALVDLTVFKDLLEDLLIDLGTAVRQQNSNQAVSCRLRCTTCTIRLTFGMGIASSDPASPISSSMFLMSTERSATSRSTSQSISLMK